MYFSEIHELERQAERYDPLAALSSAGIPGKTVSGRQLSSTRKRLQNERGEVISDLPDLSMKQHAELLTEPRESNKHRAELVKLVGELVDVVKRSLSK